MFRAKQRPPAIDLGVRSCQRPKEAAVAAACRPVRPTGGPSLSDPTGRGRAYHCKVYFRKCGFVWHSKSSMVDPYQIRRDLIAIRSRHSGNVAVTKPINKLLGKIAHVREIDSPASEAELNRQIAERQKHYRSILSPASGTSRRQPPIVVAAKFPDRRITRSRDRPERQSAASQSSSKVCRLAALPRLVMRHLRGIRIVAVPYLGSNTRPERQDVARSKEDGLSRGRLRPLLGTITAAGGGEAVMKPKRVDRRNVQAADDHGCESFALFPDGTPLRPNS